MLEPGHIGAVAECGGDEMTEFLAGLFIPYYLQIKWLHLIVAAMWLFSTSVAYRFYLLPIFAAWLRDPGSVDKARLRNWAMERFDDGATLEHVAFPRSPA